MGKPLSNKEAAEILKNRIGEAIQNTKDKIVGEEVGFFTNPNLARSNAQQRKAMMEALKQSRAEGQMHLLDLYSIQDAVEKGEFDDKPFKGLDKLIKLPSRKQAKKANKKA